MKKIGQEAEFLEIRRALDLLEKAQNWDEAVSMYDGLERAVATLNLPPHSGD